jgi:hypothetical protein
LAVVPDSPGETSNETVLFCGHCGTRPEGETNSRVCESCGLGILLQSNMAVAPVKGSAFLVIDNSMSVCAVSGAAEMLLATRETDAVNRHLTELVVPADAEAQGPKNLANAVTWAARGESAVHRVFVRPAKTFGIRISARIASCGPPSAALIVLD